MASPYNTSDEENQELLDVATSIILKNKETRLSKSNKWNKIKAGVFVTAYHRKYNDLNKTLQSSNVWCCMSNGEYDGKQSVYQNTIESAKICSSEDDRRSNLRPEYIDISILQPSPYKSVPKSSLRRDKHITIKLRVLGRSAFYLPSVWNEEPNWTYKDLIQHLTKKALGNIKTFDSIKDEDIEVFEIPTYDIRPKERKGGNGNGNGYEDNILRNIHEFYTYFANKKTNKLAYLIGKDGIVKYANQGAWVRTYSDITQYYKLCKYLKLNINYSYINKAILDFRSDDIASIAARLSFLIEINSDNKEEMDKSADILISEESYIGQEDISFVTPQAMIAIVKYRGNNLPQIVYKRFLDMYSEKLVREAIKENEAFAANWILQAFAVILPFVKDLYSKNNILYIIREILIPECEEAIKSQQSITIVACAFNGIMSIYKYLQDHQKEYFQKEWDKIITKWYRLQKEWDMKGGFRYYEDENWYRTDVTSHVVEIILFYLKHHPFSVLNFPIKLDKKIISIIGSFL